MNKTQIKNIKKWLAALRSGDYEQGMGQLCIPVNKTDEGENPQYCCLGVACYITKKGKERINKWAKKPFVPPSVFDFDEHFGLSEKFLPSDANLAPDESNPVQRYLADLNDTDGFSFSQIARKIEQMAIRQLKAEGHADLWDEVQI